MGHNLSKNVLVIVLLGFILFAVFYLFPKASASDMQFELMLTFIWGVGIMAAGWHYVKTSHPGKSHTYHKAKFPTPDQEQGGLKDFFIVASHELRAPLTVIRGNMAMIRDYYFKEIKNPDIMRIVASTHASAVRLIKIVSDFLDASRLEQGRTIFAITQVDTNDIIDQVIDELSYFAKINKNGLMFSPDPSLPMAAADPNRLKQVIYNLLANAINYTKDGVITIFATKTNKGIRITIEDTGIGIDKEKQEQLFQRFQPINPEAGDLIPSTGMGLYISKLLMDAQNGEIGLESSLPGKGSKFYILIPTVKK